MSDNIIQFPTLKRSSSDPPSLEEVKENISEEIVKAIFPDLKGNMPSNYSTENINFLSIALPWMKVDSVDKINIQKKIIKY